MDTKIIKQYLDKQKIKVVETWTSPEFQDTQLGQATIDSSSNDTGERYPIAE